MSMKWRKLKGSDILGRLGRYKAPILCICTGFVIYIAARWIDPLGSDVVTRLNRRSYGKSADTVKLYVEGLGDDALPVDIAVSAQRYTDEELEKAFERCMEELVVSILGSNDSLAHVTGDLVLAETAGVPGISVSWTSSDRKVLKSNGSVINEELKEPVEVSLLAELSDGMRHELYTIPVTIYPKPYSEAQQLLAGLTKEIAAKDKDSATESALSLPTQYLGRDISFQTKAADYSYIWMLGILMGVLLVLKDKEEKKKARQQREMQMQLDYPEIVSKLMIFTGAGLSVRSSIEAIAQDYKSRSEQTRYAYEEMCILSNKLNSGVSESAAYNAMGRSGGRTFMKLAGLLEQNRRSGLADLGMLLEAEMREAWENRKNLARRMGEEASTKLLIPLLMMLVLVMIIVMVPALVSF